MVTKRHENKIQGSGIRAVIIYTGNDCGMLGPRLIVEKQSGSWEDVLQDQLAKFLNEKAGRSGPERKISQELEEAIFKSFSSVLKKEKDVYTYTGCKSLTYAEAEQLYKIKKLTNDYEGAPKRIIRLNDRLVVDENRQVLPIGITPMRVSLSAKKLGESPLKQSSLNQAVCTAAREFTLLPHIKYKDSINGRENIYGTMPIAFFENIESYSFQSHKEVKPSDAVKSIFYKGQEPLILDCSTGVQIIHYKALLNFLGEEKFNDFFSAGVRVEQCLSDKNPTVRARDELNSDWHTIVESPEDMLKNIIPGDTIYISNIKPYAKRHPSGESPGFNVIYLGKNEDGQHEFGSLFTEKKVHTYDEIIDLMIRDYNKIPYDMCDKVDQLEQLNTTLKPESYASGIKVVINNQNTGTDFKQVEKALNKDKVSKLKESAKMSVGNITRSIIEMVRIQHINLSPKTVVTAVALALAIQRENPQTIS